MARAIGLTNMVITRIASDQRKAGPVLMRKIVERLGVDAEWLLRGSGQPFHDEDVSGLRPVYKAPPKTRQASRPKGQGVYINLSEQLTNTQYWLMVVGELRRQFPYANSRDVILMESDPTRFPAIEMLFNHLCVVRRKPLDEEVQIGVVTHYSRDAEDPERIDFKTLEQLSQPTFDEYVITHIPGELPEVVHQKMVRDPRSGVRKKLGYDQRLHGRTTTISEGEIIAVWTCVFYRSDYADYRRKSSDDPT